MEKEIDNDKYKKLLEYFDIEDYSPELCKLKGTFRDFLFRATPGVFLYSLLILTFILPFFDVRQMLLFVFIFGLYNLYVGFHATHFSFKHLQNKTIADKTNFKLEHAFTRETLIKNGVPPDSLIKWEDVIHFCLIPNYKEQTSNLEEMIETMTVQSVAKQQMIIVLAFEQREGLDVIEHKFTHLHEKFSRKFLDFVHTIHPTNIPGELAGKSSNEAWAAKQIFEDVEKRGYPKENVLISIFDADSLILPKHFDFITATFANDPNRSTKIYQAAMAGVKNYWATLGMTRVATVGQTLHEMACLGDKSDIHVPFSTMSYPLVMAEKVNGWDTDIIAEDWHMFIKCYFNTNGKAEVVAIPSHVPSYAIEGNGLFDSFKKRYTQAVRHAWGVSEISYFMQRWFLSYFGPRTSIQRRPEFKKTCLLFFKLVGVHTFSALGCWVIAWPSIWMFLCTWIPSIMPKQAIDEIHGFWQICFQVVMGVAFLFTLIAVFRMVTVLREINDEQPTLTSFARILFDFYIWSTFTQLLLSGLPTFICVTRLFFTDKFVYVVAEKPKTAIDVKTLEICREIVPLTLQDSGKDD